MELSFAQTEAARSLKEEQGVSAPGGWLLYRRGALFIAREQPPLPQYQEIIPLQADGAWHGLAGWGWEYLATLEPADLKAREPDDRLGRESEKVLRLELPSSLLPALVFRTRREGDAVPSAGYRGRSKLKDLFIEAKIPPYQRAAFPLLASGEEILWLPGLFTRPIQPQGPPLTVLVRKRIDA